MKSGVLDVLRCPACRAERQLELTVLERDEREIREADLRCRRCSREFSVHEGIIDLLFEPPGFVVREAAGLDRFAAVMRSDGWDRERILSLPNVDLGYWFIQKQGMRSLLEEVKLEPGRRILDIGSNTCWASNIFAGRGLEVIAVDISLTELQGLRTAEYFLDEGVYFERLRSVMFDLAIASESVDYVFCCEVLHHNDRRNLLRTLREFHRVLRPGGSLLIINEPLRFLLNLKLDHGEEVAEFDGNEHVYFLPEYYLAARRAGFRVRVRRPTGARGVTGNIWRQRLTLACQLLLTGDVTANLLATKA